MKYIAAYIDASGESSEAIIKKALDLQNNGIDELVLVNNTEEESAVESFLETARGLSRAIDIPFVIGVSARRFEDIKKAFYTGARAVILRRNDTDGTSLEKEGSDRFGKGNIYICDNGICTNGKSEVLVIGSCAASEEKAASELKKDNVTGFAAVFDNTDVMAFKRRLADLGADVNTFRPAISFDELKTGADGLVPCIVQDYRTNDVLMMAYMDREAFDKTAETGIMTYHSRSRNELWVKGLTSGHFQYLRELSCDCDKDTLLAKVVQIGAACHTGSRSCFFNEMVRHEYETKDISKVLSSLYDVVVDRKQHPKEGSYTNYLLDKGIDKILKKCGEEATEMVIAAKNPNAEELKYEIADLLYHMTVLMVECGVDWQDVAGELANR
ncbi:MAG: bifunctional phosphoribosyl-AMP cyclohydrolase/phosphoribosyl-ATP diphosphatase HisIE [Lachnospiraceae bacterium]|nr:bifunctional phosphoribosyl-AMP cyclohydrolase/phosphoribosyl-ATP diphosphatase HisIE [Lachnospiraceae bacterium]